MQPAAVYIYKGLGAKDNGCLHLLNTLLTNLDTSKYQIEFILPEELIEGSKLKGATLLAFGSGFTTGFVNALGVQGVRNVAEYVASGGSYLGFGAGGYFGCDYIEFDKNGPLEKLTERELRFYPGIGRGPVYPGFQYDSSQGLHAVPVLFNTERFTATFACMMDGGGAFYPSNPPKPGSKVTAVKNIAIFSDVPGQPTAVVKTDVGEGQAVLSGVHLEYDMVEEIKSEPKLNHLQEIFASSRLQQIAALRILLEMLGLKVN